jgi:hypothetical protein
MLALFWGPPPPPAAGATPADMAAWHRAYADARDHAEDGAAVMAWVVTAYLPKDDIDGPYDPDAPVTTVDQGPGGPALAPGGPVDVRVRVQAGADACPGPGRCHSLLTWCESCGDVADVCERAQACDVHRPRRQWAAARAAVKAGG